jgi:hypothetical protein
MLVLFFFNPQVYVFTKYVESYTFYTLLVHTYTHTYIYIHILLFIYYLKNQGWIKTEEGKWWKETRDIEQNPRQLHIVRSMQIRVRYNIKQVHWGENYIILLKVLRKTCATFMQTSQYY